MVLLDISNDIWVSGEFLKLVGLFPGWLFKKQSGYVTAKVHNSWCYDSYFYFRLKGSLISIAVQNDDKLLIVEGNSLSK